MFNRRCLVIFDIWKDEREDLLEQISQIIGKVLQMVNLSLFRLLVAMVMKGAKSFKVCKLEQ